jgi:hydrogenase nickel insertion protein HypA
MHEYTITVELIEQVLRVCNQRDIGKVKEIITELGTFTTFTKESILFYFDAIKKDIPALEDTKLVIHTENARMKCNTCKKINYVEHPYIIACPHCDSNNINIFEGKDFKVKSLVSDD